MEFDFEDILVKSVSAKGKRISNKAIRKISSSGKELPEKEQLTFA